MILPCGTSTGESRWSWSLGHLGSIAEPSLTSNSSLSLTQLVCLAPSASNGPAAGTAQNSSPAEDDDVYELSSANLVRSSAWWSGKESGVVKAVVGHYWVFVLSCVICSTSSHIPLAQNVHRLELGTDLLFKLGYVFCSFCRIIQWLLPSAFYFAPRSGAGCEVLRSVCLCVCLLAYLRIHVISTLVTRDHA